MNQFRTEEETRMSAVKKGTPQDKVRAKAAVSKRRAKKGAKEFDFVMPTRLLRQPARARVVRPDEDRSAD